MNVADIDPNQGGGPPREEFNAAVVSVLPRLRRFCMSIAGSHSGDDLCQATVLSALANAHQFKAGTRLDSWLFRMARNQHIDNQRRLRTRGREDALDTAADLVGDDGVRTAEGRSDLDRVTFAFDRLPDEQRTVMMLVVVEGQSYKEAAEVLEIPIGTVMSRIARARRALDRSLHGESAA